MRPGLYGCTGSHNQAGYRQCSRSAAQEIACSLCQQFAIAASLQYFGFDNPPSDCELGRAKLAIAAIVSHSINAADCSGAESPKPSTKRQLQCGIERPYVQLGAACRMRLQRQGRAESPTRKTTMMRRNLCRKQNSEQASSSARSCCRDMVN